ncbi:MAG: FAD-binding oxidoreductase [Prolixibacteraceae bacterium]|nr:FAD-binding oxidoreductase [Prolixibacteraceae bacterium]
MEANVDFLIVGQGLAGTLLSFELIRRKQSVVVFDDPEKPKASSVAAGLINPVVFRRMTKSWMVDAAFPQMEMTYRNLELLLRSEFYFPSSLVKILNEDLIDFWKSKAFANQLTSYVSPDCYKNQPIGNLKNNYSFGAVNKSGRVDLQKLIAEFSDYLNFNKLLFKEPINNSQIQFADTVVIYKGIQAKKIIFCEGAAASENPFFSQLNFKHSKGEVLELHIPELSLETIISNEIFVMPVENNHFRVGATYGWDNLNWEPTPSAREELQTKLKTFIDQPLEFINHSAGIRPTMHDRKPVVGLLPHQPEIGIFNGLGSKGVLLGPYFAHQFAEYLTGNSEYIHPEANILRYFKTR